MDSQNAIHPSRWRETCDPFALEYHTFQLHEVLGYPHARNDVFHVRGMANGREVTAYVKATRQNESSIEHEVDILNQLDSPLFPKVLDYDRKHGSFSVTAEMSGLRLSTILANDASSDAFDYMEEYGEALGRLHQMNLASKPQADRKFHHRPDPEMLKTLNLQFLTDFFDREPTCDQTVFCHGDFHYANVLWKDRRISAILDFELAGYGNRDFDIAWALFLRPGQKFLKTEREQAQFIKGYRKYGECNTDAIKYYMAQCYVHFLCFCDNEKDYSEYVRNWLQKNYKDA